MMVVSDMGLNWLHSVKGHSLGKLLTFASLHMRGRHCGSIERLNSLVITGAKRCEKSFHNQYRSPSGPGAVLFSFIKKIMTVGSSTA